MNSTVRKTLTLVLVLFAALVVAGCALRPPVAEYLQPSSAAAKAETRTTIVAKVNNAELSLDALISMMNALPDKSGNPPETLEQRRQRALESLVLLELAYQRAVALGLTVGPDTIETAMVNFKDTLGGEKEYREYLVRRTITEEALRSEVERKLTINFIYTREVEDAMAIPEEELRKEYEKDTQRFMLPEKVSIVDVYLTTSEDKTAKKRARALLRKIQADPAQDPWKLVLDNTFMVRNLIVSREREKELYDAARKLRPQGLSGVIRTPDSFHIIKLKEYAPERQRTFEEARPKIEAALKGRYLEKRTQGWEQGLKKDATIVLLDTPEHQKQEPR
jgi:parvulin-like peptidyl-prolyl isomerase